MDSLRYNSSRTDRALSLLAAPKSRLEGGNRREIFSGLDEGGTSARVGSKRLILVLQSVLVGVKDLVVEEGERKGDGRKRPN